MQPTAFEQAALHACKVGAWVIGSAVIPAILTLYSGNAWFLALTPFINGLGSSLMKWSKIHQAAAAAALRNAPQATGPVQPPQ